MHDGQATISPDILARYAADAAREVPGVAALSGRRPVKIDGASVELHLVVQWGASIPEVGVAVRERVREYLTRMAKLAPDVVDVVVDEVESP